jgi:hypothetical protein
MLLQIICNPNDEYLVDRKTRNKTSGKSYNHYSSRYEERKGIESDEEDYRDTSHTNMSENCKLDEAACHEAKRLFFQYSNSLPSMPTRPLVPHYRGYKPLYTSESTLIETETQSTKLASLYLYLSRILLPIYRNLVVFRDSMKPS